MKIVFFDFVFYFGGGPQLAVDIAKRLSTDHDVQVIDVSGTCDLYIKALKDAGIKIHILNPRIKNIYAERVTSKFRRLFQVICKIFLFLRLRKKLIKKIHEINPDIIWTNSKAALLLLGLVYRRLHCPLAVEVVTCNNAAFFRGYYKWLMKHRVAVLMAISTETAKQLQLAGIKNNHIRTVFDTIDINDTLKKSVETLTVPLPGLDQHPKILVPALLLPRKGQDTAIKAVAQLKTEGMEPVLWLAGVVTAHEPLYQDYLQNLAEELNVLENVHFLGWREDVPAIMIQADMVVLPTHQEGFGHVVLEAMLLCRPVIATPVGGIKDSIQDGVNGLNFPVGDEHTLADCIKRIVSDGQLVETLTRNGYTTATKIFSPENHTKRFLAGLRFAIQSKGESKKEL